MKKLKTNHRILREFYDVENGSDIEQVRQAVYNAGGTIKNEEHFYDDERLELIIECENIEPFTDLEWMGTEVTTQFQGDGLGGSF